MFCARRQSGFLFKICRESDIRNSLLFLARQKFQHRIFRLRRLESQRVWKFVVPWLTRESPETVKLYHCHGEIIYNYKIDAWNIEIAVAQTEKYSFFFYCSQENRDKLTERAKKQTTTSVFFHRGYNFLWKRQRRLVKPVELLLIYFVESFENYPFNAATAVRPWDWIKRVNFRSKRSNLWAERKRRAVLGACISDCGSEIRAHAVRWITDNSVTVRSRFNEQQEPS